MPASSTIRRRLSIALLLALVGAAVFAYRAAVRVLHDEVVGALGPEAEIGAVALGWAGVTLADVRIRGAASWPSGDALRAKRVVIVPSLLTLLSSRVEIRSVTIEELYLSAFRSRDDTLSVLPSLLGSRDEQAHAGSARVPATNGERGREGHGEPEASDPQPGTTATIRRLHIQDGVFEFFNARVQTPAHKMRFEDVDVTVRDLLVPDLAGRTHVELAAMVKGLVQDGRIEVSGWADVADEDCEIAARLKGVDLKTLEPYLVQEREGGIRSGSLDLELDSSLDDGQLRAPGRLTISKLELAPARGGAAATFMGVSRTALLAFMKNEDGHITVSFVVEGDVRNPQFSLRNSLTSRIAASMAQTLGVTVNGAAATAQAVGRSGIDAAKKAGSGAGHAIKRFFDGLRSR